MTEFNKMADSILDKLSQSITASTNDPTTPLDHRTFEEAELVLAQTLSPAQNLQIVSSLSSLLQTLQQDPTPAVNLLLKLVDKYSYGDILKFGNIPFKDGLAVGDHMGSYNRLIISILRKAALNAADTASVASMLDTVSALVKLWLCTKDTGVATSAQQLILDLLRVDQELQGPDAHIPAGGQGLLWRRIFGDQDIYRLFFEACTYTTTGQQSLGLSKGQRTVAAARLMELLPTVAAMDWNVVTRSHHQTTEQEFASDGGLLGFAALHMVEKDDVIMYQSLINFYSNILVATAPKASELGAMQDSAGLRYLIASGVHANTAAIYLQIPGRQVDPLEATFLYGPAANYVATYAACFSEHFLASQLLAQVKARLYVALDQSPARWAHAESPKHDLHVLASLPRGAILPSSSGWQSSPLSLLPSKATNPDVLNTLATIFRGPDREIVFTLGSNSGAATAPANLTKEAAEARALYYHYVANNPRFWQDVATHADTIVLKELALSSINVLRAIITANWSTTPDIPLPSNIATPVAGHLALIAPPALEYAWLYLLRPSRTFANLVGGRGDAESSAYKVATAKYDALRILKARFESEVQRSPGQGYEDILAQISKRVGEGALSREGEVGGRIGTLEL